MRFNLERVKRHSSVPNIQQPTAELSCQPIDSRRIIHTPKPREFRRLPLGRQHVSWGAPSGCELAWQIVAWSANFSRCMPLVAALYLSRTFQAKRIYPRGRFYSSSVVPRGVGGRAIDSPVSRIVVCDRQ